MGSDWIALNPFKFSETFTKYLPQIHYFLWTIIFRLYPPLFKFISGYHTHFFWYKNDHENAEASKNNQFKFGPKSPKSATFPPRASKLPICYSFQLTHIFSPSLVHRFSLLPTFCMSILCWIIASAGKILIFFPLFLIIHNFQNRVSINDNCPKISAKIHKNPSPNNSWHGTFDAKNFPDSLYCRGILKIQNSRPFLWPPFLSLVIFVGQPFFLDSKIFFQGHVFIKIALFLQKKCLYDGPHFSQKLTGHYVGRLRTRAHFLSKIISCRNFMFIDPFFFHLGHPFLFSARSFVGPNFINSLY